MNSNSNKRALKLILAVVLLWVVPMTEGPSYPGLTYISC